METNEIKVNVLDYLKLTPSELEAIEEMARRISKDLPRKIYDEPFMYYRFLKAREFDVDEAERMLRQSLQWRKDNNVDEILKDYKPPEVLENFFKNFMFGYDKEGCPVYYMQSGKSDLRGLHMSARYTDIAKTLLCIAEEGEEIIDKQSKKLNKYVEGLVHIYDMEGLTLGSAIYKKGTETMIRFLKMQQDNYPERMKAFYVINASPLFTVLFNVIKPFLSARMISKVNVYGTEGWKEALLELMDADQLPVCLGGTRTDPDGNPLCKTIISFYLTTPTA